MSGWLFSHCLAALRIASCLDIPIVSSIRMLRWLESVFLSAAFRSMIHVCCPVGGNRLRLHTGSHVFLQSFCGVVSAVFVRGLVPHSVYFVC